MPNFMLIDRAVSEIQSTKVSFLGMDFAAKTRKTTGFPGVCGFPTTTNLQFIIYHWQFWSFW